MSLVIRLPTFSTGQCQHGCQQGLVHGPKKGDVSLTEARVQVLLSAPILPTRYSRVAPARETSTGVSKAFTVTEAATRML